MTNHQRTERSTAGPGTGSAFVPRLPDCAPNIKEGPVPGVLATALSIGVIGGPWFPAAAGRGWHVLLASAVIALIALLYFSWLYSARSTRRWKAALDACAAREIARDRRRKAPPLEPRAHLDGLHL
jgi:hypothetical protein